MALDCAIIEINPLVVTGAGDIVALDAKVSFDDNALLPPSGDRKAARRGARKTRRSWKPPSTA